MSLTETETSNTGFVHRLFEEGWNNQSFEFLEGRTAARVAFHFHGENSIVTPESLAGLVAMWHAAFPDLEMTLRHVIAHNDLVAASLVMTGTHEGEWQGVPASGNAVRAEEMMFFRFEGELLVEMWEVFDEQGLKAQLLHRPTDSTG